MSSNPLAMPVDEAIGLLIASYNQETHEFDELVERLEKMEAENLQLAEVIKKYEQDATTVLDKAEKSDQLLAQANRERDQAVNKTKDQDILLRGFKEIGATPKKVREKIKGYQDRLEKQRLAAEQHKRNFNDERKTTAALRKEIAELTNRLDAAGINQVYREDNDIVQTYPYHLGGMIEGYDPRMTPLLYLHQSGRGGLILLNDEDEAELVETPKGGIRPKKATLEHCGQWLRRVKANNWDVERADLESLSHGSE
ncbi:MAG: hypothetical protein MK214_15150 [Thalassotalea sp.]|nr:hypothetical protein [Thalassotalea sp.]